MFNYKYRYYFALLLSVYTYLNTEFCDLYEHFNIVIDWYYALITITLISFIILEVNRLLESRIRKISSFKINTIRFPIVFFLVSGLVATIITTSIVWFIGMYIYKYSFRENIIPLKLNLIYAWLVNLLYHLINTVIFYFKECKISQHQAKTLRKLNAQAELQIVKNQINPHFLFNNLNVLSTLVLQNNDEANKFIEEFSKVYRYILSNHEKELVELKTELHFIRPYLFLLEKRFGNGLVVEIDVNEINHHKYIIPAALQMLIENAIKHNVISKQKPLNIKISINKDNHIVVINNLQLRKSSEPSTQIGLKNIIKRYQLFADEKVIVKEALDFFSVTIPLINVAKKDYEIPIRANLFPTGAELLRV